jgi:Protein of unknown function (DUF3822)
MNYFKYVSEEYNLNHTKNYRLSIQLNQDGFSVLIATDEKKILKIYHKNLQNQIGIAEELKENPFLNEITKLSYKKVKIILNTRTFTLIPNEFFDPNTSVAFFMLEQNISESKAILSNLLNSDNIKLLFDSSAFSSLIRLFLNSPEIVHVYEPQIRYIKEKLSPANAIILYQAGKILHILNFIQGKLYSCNAFETNTKNDTLYYSYAFLKEIFNKHGKIELFYSGMLHESDLRSTQLKHFISEFHCLPNEMPFEMAGFEFENYFTNLLVSSDCVL